MPKTISALSVVLGERPYAASATLIASLMVLIVISQSARSSIKPKNPLHRIPSPRETLIPLLSSAQVAALPYPPDLLPCSRDVATPYGTMRVNEWGPEEGKKVVLIHGDTTPAPVLGPIAEALVRRGCRVILFDLWGRGYSDTPLDVPHNSTLFGMQIFFATASSRISWTGPRAFSIVAFSLGGAIAMSFSSYFPDLVDSIVLLAPGGILRSLPKEYENPCFRYPSLVPQYYLRKVVANLLGVSRFPTPLHFSKSDYQDQTVPETSREVKGVHKGIIDIPRIVQWQFDHHKGFMHSFINTIRHGPYMYQHSEWEGICNVIKGEIHSRSRLFNGKILVVFGDTDGVVVEKDVSADLFKMIGGADHITFRSVPGGHGFPMPSCEEVIKHISEFWGLHVED